MRSNLEKNVSEKGLTKNVWFYGSCYDEQTNAELIQMCIRDSYFALKHITFSKLISYILIGLAVLLTINAILSDNEIFKMGFERICFKAKQRVNTQPSTNAPRPQMCIRDSS